MSEDIRKRFTHYYSAPGRQGVQYIQDQHAMGRVVAAVWRVSGGPWSYGEQDEWALVIGPIKSTHIMGYPDSDQSYLSFKTRKAALTHLSALLESHAAQFKD
jgi:hypothetical protein